jgi:hypothetical protein
MVLGYPPAAHSPPGGMYQSGSPQFQHPQPHYPQDAQAAGYGGYDPNQYSYGPPPNGGQLQQSVVGHQYQQPLPQQQPHQYQGWNPASHSP